MLTLHTLDTPLDSFPFSPSVLSPHRYRSLSALDSDSIPEIILTDAQKAQIQAEFGTDSASLAMRNKSPRWGPGEITFKSDSATDKYGLPEYEYGIVLCFAIGVAVAILQFLLTGLYMFLRCCCWRCLCKKKSEWEEPNFPGWTTLWSKYWPIFFLLFFVAVACAAAILGIVYNNGVSKTFSTTDESNGVGPLVLQSMTSFEGWVSDILDRVQGIADDIPPIGTALDGIAARVTGLDVATNALQSQTSVFGSQYGISHPIVPAFSNYTVRINGESWVCDTLCLGMGLGAGVLAGEIQANVVPSFHNYSGAERNTPAQRL